MPDEIPPATPEKPKKVDGRSSRKRRARPNWSARRKAAELKKKRARDAINARIAARESERQAKIDAAKAEFQKLLEHEAAKKDAKLAASMPVDVVELCRLKGLPLDTPCHPRYNLLGVPPDTSLQRVEAIAFGRDWPAEWGGLGAYLHFRNFVELTWPDIQWNPWLEEMSQSLCDPSAAIMIGQTKMRFVNWVGAGSCGKTFCAGLFACAWFIVDMANGFAPRSSVTLTSTSKGIIAQRVWPVIQKLFHEAQIFPTKDKLKWGHMIDSQKIVCAMSNVPGEEKKRDMKHSICALAVESGELVGALDKIKGRHTERMMLIVDEANSTPQAIFECIPNMLTSVRELIVLVIGNAGSRLDPHGLCCEPRRGWKSITIEDTMWDTKGVDKWGIGPGVCLHFDGAKSPNVLAGRTEHKHIYSFERWQQVLRMGDEYRNTLQHWSQDRGFWPPDGLSTTVFSESLVRAHDGMGKFSFFSEVNPCASLDPAFGGDDCLIQFGVEGDIRQGRRAILLTDWKLVPFDPDSNDPIDYQMARWVIKECKARGIDPRWFGLDATGIGRGVAAILRHEWSNSIQVIEFGGAASDLPASQDDPRPSREVYSNRVTELWYSTREMLIANQIKGLSQRAVSEFCGRTYEFVNRRYRVEPKSDMRSRIGKSPDCFVSGTLISTPDGVKPIELLREGDLVSTPYGPSPVLVVHKTETTEIVDLEFGDGTKLSGKGSHRIFVWNKGWVRMDAIVLTDVIESVKMLPAWNILNRLFTKAQSTSFKAMVDITRTETIRHRRGFYIESSGLSITGLFLKASLSITKTMIGRTMKSATLSLKTLQATAEIIREKGFQILSGLLNAEKALRKHRQPLQFGMEAKRESLGTESTPPYVSRRENQGILFARNVDLSFQQKRSQRQCFAQNIATGKHSKKRSKQEFLDALSALRAFFTTSITTRSIVRKNVSQLPQTQPKSVYNITLLEHNVYYANGVLVENCADAVTILGEVARRNGLIISQGPSNGKKSDSSNWREIADSLTDIASSDYSEASNFSPYAEVA